MLEKLKEKIKEEIEDCINTDERVHLIHGMGFSYMQNLILANTIIKFDDVQMDITTDKTCFGKHFSKGQAQIKYRDIDKIEQKASVGKVGIISLILFTVLGLIVGKFVYALFVGVFLLWCDYSKSLEITTKDGMKHIYQSDSARNIEFVIKRIEALSENKYNSAD